MNKRCSTFFEIDSAELGKKRTIAYALLYDFERGKNYE